MLTVHVAWGENHNANSAAWGENHDANSAAWGENHDANKAAGGENHDKSLVFCKMPGNVRRMTVYNCSAKRHLTGKDMHYMYTICVLIFAGEAFVDLGFQRFNFTFFICGRPCLSIAQEPDLSFTGV